MVEIIRFSMLAMTMARALVSIGFAEYTNAALKNLIILLPEQ